MNLSLSRWLARSGRGSRHSHRNRRPLTAAFELLEDRVMLSTVQFSDEVRVNASTDDAEEEVANGSVSLTSSDLELIADGVDDQLVGMRFNGVDVPNGATIINAYIQFEVDEISTGTTSLSIVGEAADNAATFSSATFNISSRTSTAASVAWAPPDWNTISDAGVDQRTPNLAPVIQEIIDRSGWSADNSLVLIVTGSGERTAESYNGESANAPLLHIDYEIDTVEESRVNASSDDAEERIATSAVILNSTDLELIREDGGSGSFDQTVGVRFNNVAIPNGVTITSAYVQFQTDEVTSEATSLQINGEDTDDAATFSATDLDISSRTPTFESVAWNPTAWNVVGEAGANQQTPDITAIIQDIIDRPGWSLDNSLALLITGSGQRIGESFDGDAAAAPLLHVEWDGSPFVQPEYDVKHSPYLQLGDAPLVGLPGSGTDQIEILWQTIPSGPGSDDSFVVDYRLAGTSTWTSVGSIGTIATGVEGRINHSVVIAGLTYDTDYEYRVIHDRAGVPLATFQETFRTRLPAGDNTDFTFVAYGDSAGLTSLANFQTVQDQINQIDAATGVEFALVLGDNAYNDGTHPQYDARLDPSVVPEATDWNSDHIDFLAYGNHDIKTDGGGPTEENYSNPIPVQGVTSPVAPPVGETPEHNYSFDYGNVHFVTFDSNSRFDGVADQSDPIPRLDDQLDWVVADLQASTAQWKVAFVHHHIGGGADHNDEGPNDTYFQEVVSRLYAAGADLLLTGHDHTYAWTYPLLGETGGAADFVLDTDKDYEKGAGLVNVISGVGGRSIRGDTPYSAFPYVAAGYSQFDSTSPPRLSEFGFAQIDVTPTQLTVSYVAADDGEVIDSFTITDTTDNFAPTASFATPADGGPGDLDPDVNEVLVGSSQPSFQVQLADIGDGIDDATVTSATVTVEKDSFPFAVDFSYDAANDLITLTPTGGGNFGIGVYSVAVSDGAAKIQDLAANDLVNSIFTVEIAIQQELQVKHNPRLQLGDAPLDGFPGSGTDQIEILWQTIPTGLTGSDSFTVEYRAVGAPSWTASGAISTIDTGIESRIIHFVEIDGLLYDSDYEYRVQHVRGDSVVIGTYQDTFHTRLPVGDQTSFTFAAYGDSAGISSIDTFRNVQNQINLLDATPSVDVAFSLLLGDNVYNSGSHPESDARLDPTINPEAADWIASHVDYFGFGNHDVGTSAGLPGEENYSSPIIVEGVTSPAVAPVGETPEHNYSFDYGDVHFATFDTNSLNNATRLDAQLDWLEADLAASTAKWNLVYGHHPVAGVPDKGENPGDNYYQEVVSRLRTAGVDMFLVGHSHTYGWTYPLLGQTAGVADFILDTDKDYEKGAGLVQLVSGAGGRSLRDGTFGQFAFVAAGFSNDTTPVSEDGFARVDVTPTQLTVSYVSGNDGHVIDSFTITDGPDVTPPDASLADPADGAAGDLDPDADEVLLATTQPAFEIQLTDSGSGIDDATVTAATVSVMRDAVPFAVDFSYNAAGDRITLTPTGGGNFGDGLYAIAVSQGAAKIADLAAIPNQMAGETFQVEIDTTIATVSFQQDVAGYTDTHDTFLYTIEPDTPKGSQEDIDWDQSTGGGETTSLIQFANIFGLLAGQVPSGSNILQATLHYEIFDEGDSAAVHEVAVAWNEATVTLNSFGPAAGIQATDYRASQIATADGVLGSRSIDVTASLQAWAADASLNHGWILLATATSGTHARSSEYTVDVAQRPELVVQFQAPSNVAPTADAGGPYGRAEGTSIGFAGSATDDPADVLTFEWDFDYDGTTFDVDATGVDLTNPSNTYADNGTFTVALRVWDDEGAESLIDTATVTVSNVAPSLTISGDATVGEGGTYLLSLSSSDPGADTISQWDIDWGDGSAVETVAGNPSSTAHVYSTQGSYTISATATDEDGTFNANSLPVTVNLDGSPFTGIPLTLNQTTDGDFSSATSVDYIFTLNDTTIVSFDILSNHFAGSQPSPANSATSSPGTVVSSGSSIFAWATPGNATASNNTYAKVVGPDEEEGFSKNLDLTNFNFSIPTGATIDGITVQVEGRAQQDYHEVVDVILLKGGSVHGADRGTNDEVFSNVADTTVTFGGAADLWAGSWTDADINAGNFGVRLAFLLGNDDDQETGEVWIDHVQVTIDYTEITATDDATEWTLISSDMTAIVSDRRFLDTDGVGAATVAYVLAPDHYKLTLSNTDASPPSYSFRLLNVDTAGSPFTPGATQSSSLVPATETDVYQFTANVGETFNFDAITGGAELGWRLLDPSGSELFASGLDADHNGVTLGATGSYTFLVEGDVQDESASKSYSFNVVPPTATSSGTGAVNEAGIYTLNLSTTVITPTSWNIDWGDGSGVEAVAGNPPSVTHVYANGDANHTVNATANTATDSYAAAPHAVTVSNVAPTANAGGPYNGAEGTSIGFSGSATDVAADVLTFEWDFDYDGTTFDVDATGIDLTTPSNIYADDGTFTVALRVRDDEGAESLIDSATVTVSNVAPTAEAGGPYSGNEGTSIGFSGSATDVAADVLTFEWDFDYDGTTFDVDATGVDLTNLSNTYADNGTFTVALRVRDDEEAESLIDTATVTVSNVAPIADAGGPYGGAEGASIGFSGSATDVAADVLTFEWDFDYDGTTFDVDATGIDLTNPSNTYAGTGTFTVALRVRDDEGAESLIDTTTVTVSNSNVAPTADVGGPYSGAEGTSIGFSGSANDDPADVLTFEWDFDYDGTTFDVDATGIDLTTPSNTYADNGTFTVALRVRDDEGAESLIDAATVTVTNVAPIADAGGPYSGDEGTSIGLSGSATDVAADVLTFEWDFDYDGSTFDVDATGIDLTNPSNTYADNGTFTVALRVRDDEGAESLIDTATVTVLNVAPTSNAGGPYSGDEGTSIGFSGSATDVAADVLTFEWDFDYDGSTFDVDASGVDLTNPSNTYADNGTFTVALRVRDDEGAESLIDTATVTVDVVGQTGPFLRTGIVAGVGSSSWTTVTLNRSYASMVVVAVPNYTEATDPGVVRIQLAQGNSFQVRVDSTDGGVIGGVTVHYMVVEEGVYTQAEHGVTMEAVKFTSTVTDRKSSWNGESRSYANTYSSPVVLGQVMTTADANFSVFWSRGGLRTGAPTSTTLFVGKHVGEDSNTIRADETIGYVVIESGNGTIDGVGYVAALGGDSILGMDDNPPQSYALTHLSSPSTAIAIQAAMDGGNGSWAVLYGPNAVTATDLALAVDEDVVKDDERKHTNEQVGYIVFDDVAAPQAGDDSYQVDEDTQLDVLGPGILLDDSGGDGSPLQAVLESDVGNGTLILGSDGSFTYLPDPDFHGTDQFTYRATDGTTPSNIATVTITVDPINDAPTLTTVSTLTGAIENTPFVINYSVLASAADEADVDGNPISFRVEGVLAGTLTKQGVPVTPGVTLLSAGETWEWTPPTDTTGVQDAITVRAHDSLLTSTSDIVVAVDVATTAAGPFLRTGVVSDVGSGTWTTVTLDRSFTSMVVVTTPNYTETSTPAVVRIRNASGDSFELLADSTDGSSVSGITVHYMVVEEGVFTQAEHGVTMEAVKFTSTVTDRKSSWVGQSRTYANAYTAPVVFGQVMTSVDPNFSVFWSRGASRQSVASSTTLFVGKHVAEDPNSIRADETIGYIVVESGSGSIDGVGYVAALGGDSILGMDDAPPQTYTLSGLNSASTAIATQAAMDGNNGGWAVLYGANAVTATALALSIEEDVAKDAERSHTHEQVGYIVFEDVQPLQASAARATAVDTTPLTSSLLAPVVEEAIARWESAGLDAASVETLSNFEIRIGDLGGTLLAVTSGGIVTIDDDAAGFGWFIDPTPADDAEFRASGRFADRSADAAGQMDLLTVIMHELGHVIAPEFEHANATHRSVMQELLAPGVRRSPMPADLDALFADPRELGTLLDKEFPHRGRFGSR